VTRHKRTLACLLAVMVSVAVASSGPVAWADRQKLAVSRIFFEYNASANDLGVHVSLDGQNWEQLSIINPRGTSLFEVEGSSPFATLGLTELRFEGAEPNLDEFPLDDLLRLFPAGTYQFSGRTVGGEIIEGTGTLTHAIPAGPKVSATVGPGNRLVILWTAVTGPPPGFPNRRITIAGYQVIIGSFQVTVPAKTLKVTVPPEFVASLPSGANQFEVLAIEASGNQTITEGTFTK